MALLDQLEHWLLAVFAAVCSPLREIWVWWLGQVLAVPWQRAGEFSWPKILLLLASIAIVIFLLFRAGRELYAAGAKALSAFVTLVRVLAKAILPIMLAGAAAGAGAWIVNHVQL